LKLESIPDHLGCIDASGWRRAAEARRGAGLARQGFPEEQAWVSGILEIEAARISVKEKLASYPLDSAEIIELLGELEDWLGYDVPVSVQWDRSAIATIAKSIAPTEARSGS
jgi:acyl carrier protein